MRTKRPEKENKTALVRAYVHQDFKARFKAACALQNRKMSDVIEDLIEGWLMKAESTQNRKP